MAATIFTPQNQNAQQQSSRGRPVSTPIPIPYRPPDLAQPPQLTQSSVRRGNMFGPYLLLQTLGEGEFGKVKLGMHVDTGEEVAIKLIRKESVDSQSRLQKIEREIGVLRNVMHPNIVRLYDVFETEKYIGIILEYASGGELFDHILAHRYLKERDACRLFAQLISGVNYLHQKNIVHRDLKLVSPNNNNETYFGFANQFDSAKDDLMATSCGSPCYAAPELVISEGLYVGSAVDIWSCGVILYAMLSGYLPFDDDPLNPDGDNINLLYKYIINTPLVFPDYVSPDARDLLRKMLVPDPAKRCDMRAIMSHRWLAPYSAIFDFTVQELEAAANPVAYVPPPETYIPTAMSVPSNSYLTTDFLVDSKTRNDSMQTPAAVKRHTIQVEYDYPDSNGFIDYPGDEEFMFADGTRLGSSSLVPTPEEFDLPDVEEGGFSNGNYINGSLPPAKMNASLYAQTDKHYSATSTISATSVSSDTGSTPPETIGKSSTGNGSGLFTLFEGEQQHNSNPENNNHTTNGHILSPLNEYHQNSNQEVQSDEQKSSSSQTPKKRDAPRTRPVTVHGPPSGNPDFLSNYKTQNPSPKVAPSSSSPIPPVPSIHDSLTPSNILHLPTIPPPPTAAHKNSYKKGSSQEAVFNGITNKNKNQINAKTTSKPVNALQEKPLTLQSSSMTQDMPIDSGSDTSLVEEVNVPNERPSRGGKRKAFSLMVDSLKLPLTQSAATHANQGTTIKEKRKTISGSTTSGSSNAAKKVMDWFRRKSLAKSHDGPILPTPAKMPKLQQEAIPNGTSRSKINKSKPPTVIVSDPLNTSRASSFSNTTNSLANVESKLRVHHGAVDQSALTSRPPYEVFIVVKQTLVSMGIEIKREGEFKVRCVRRKRKKKRKYSPGPFKTLLRRASSNNSQLSNSVSSTASSPPRNYKKKSTPSASPTFLTTHINEEPLALNMPVPAIVSNNSNLASPNSPSSPQFGPTMTITTPENTSNNYSNSIITTPEILYGDPTVDSGEEIRFSVELCKIKNLPELYIVDLKRLKGNIWAYKFLYHTLLEKLDLSGKGGYLTVGTSGVMYTLFSGLHEYLTRKEEFYILMLGLDKAGKTTLLERIKSIFNGVVGLSPDKITQTVGLNIGKIDLNRARLIFWDLGGQTELRSLWEKYYAECHGIVFVLDSTDKERIEECKQAFERIITNEMLEGIPILMLVNKQDLPNSLKVEEVREIFNKISMKLGARDSRILTISALEGDGVREAIDWLYIRLKRNQSNRPPIFK
ncbi:6632_t:CDS:10 [Ambispora leptoticha]|uniref:non-specific serine/threonine protein kinase n=1 Tax=Ambispora leptoticha TaxID=144679 RepID=A0A9N9GHS6_9GLOM|nr:6632_t:CDS:10 [Ambispora leptoticha]